MRTWLGVGALVLLVAWAGCAKGTSAVDTGGVGGASDGATSDASVTTGVGGASATTTATTSSTSASGSTTTGSTTSTTTSTGTGGDCSETPCKLVAPQCGCGAGEACVVDSGGNPTCTAAGNASWGAQCTAQTLCEPGLLCIQTTASISTCGRFCATDADCQGALCIRTLNDGNGGAIPGVFLCTDVCDPAANTGCPVAGTGCQFGHEQDGQMRFFTVCAGAGAGTQGASCQTADDCAAGYGCFNTDPNAAQCLRWCDQNAPACPGATSCVGVTIDSSPIVVGGKTYGACY